ncbi:MAG: FIG00765533: hypothetical protein [uncultured Chloroflexia bacterium]|uniref:Uncharacterized protein n=1 Tax=uncultured Chloroflexia bacterium TaxID=1672391 RepID=A0A6J4K932_9CHLR|nr:MAG: FIG00765533: hypothetical protein [uncultured Chloroflexia bacterium]
MIDGICSVDGPVVFFPVRHHSPACARLVEQLARELRPAAILIEGPSDFNDRLDELALPHPLPIAIYTYVQLADGRRRGAFYPFCRYSPEWAALAVAREIGAQARFIDLPWAAQASSDTPAHRYADGEMRQSPYIAALCAKLGVEDFDDLWDTLFEIDELSPTDYLRRAHHFCGGMRAYDGAAPAEDVRREAFMADMIRAAQARYGGPLLVVTGGFHSPALHARINDLPLPEDAATPEAPASVAFEARGIALTPYSYARLDGLTGYEAGMPNPGFYHQVWEDRLGGVGDPYRALLAKAATTLRARGQMISAADLIAVETTARALAALRGHAEVWRRDLIDAILGAVVKDELAGGVRHPFLSALYDVFRGDERGRLAEGTTVPPLVEDIRRELHEHDLEAAPRERAVELDLRDASGLARSRVLHRLRGLAIQGYELAAGTDLARRDDLTTIGERWRIRWTPELDASCIEAAIYGPSLAEACRSRLVERAAGIERDAEAAALLLLDAGLMGLAADLADLPARLIEVIRGDGDFFTVTGALGHLLYLYRYDDALGTAGAPVVGVLLAEAWARGLWLLDGMGQVAGQDSALLRGMDALLQTFQGCGTTLDLHRDSFVDTLARTSADSMKHPLLRGAASGALWTMRAAQTEQVLADLKLCAEPSQMGDFLTGLFALARETVQREADLLLAIDALLMSYDDEAFLHALPALRLAFSFFTPREKHYLARGLLEARGASAATRLPDLEVSPEVAVRALALESAVFAVLAKYGLRGGSHA